MPRSTLRPLALLGLCLAVGGACAFSRTESPPPSIDVAESAYVAVRDLADELEIGQSLGQSVGPSGRPLADLRMAYRQGLPAARDLAARARPRSPAEEAALARLRVALASEMPELEASNATAPGAATCLAPKAIAALPGGAGPVAEALYACFGERARRIEFEGEPLDRLSLFGRLADEPDRDRRRRLFLALRPLWEAVDGEVGGGAHPYRELVRRGASEWRANGSPITRQLTDLGFDPDAFERDLEAILAAWRDTLLGERIEPWDLHWRHGQAARELNSAVPVEGLESIQRRFYADLGADPEALGVRYDLRPREGKTPVAFCTFGSRGRWRNSDWSPTVPWVFATYRDGGFDNLVELLHETGHAVHLAGIRTRPVFLDWPDSDAFTEGLGDLLALEAYEPEWQRRYLGRSVDPAVSHRAKYGSIVLDIAWALFEIRLHRAPERAPNEVWSEITESYLGVRSHPEWSWWALRGQLVSSPGYMANYAIGAVLVADLRAEARRQRGPLWQSNSGWYAWLSDRLYRFGRERASREVIEAFLGRRVSTAALLEDLRAVGRTEPTDRERPVGTTRAR